MIILPMTREEMRAQAKPISFCQKLVPAVRDESKTQTRRVVKPKRKDGLIHTAPNGKPAEYRPYDIDSVEFIELCKPRYKVGDILYVKETWQSFFPEEVTPNHQRGSRSCSGIPAESAKGHYMYYYYRADGEVPDHPKYGKAVWMSWPFMPKAAARTFVRVTAVRAERLQEITMEDAVCEGVMHYDAMPKYTLIRNIGGNIPRSNFAFIWDRLNAKAGYPWEANDWVWVYSFERVCARDEAAA
jgi:hypothetical protein